MAISCLLQYRVNARGDQCSTQVVLLHDDLMAPGWHCQYRNLTRWVLHRIHQVQPRILIAYLIRYPRAAQTTPRPSHECDHRDVRVFSNPPVVKQKNASWITDTERNWRRSSFIEIVRFALAGIVSAMSASQQSSIPSCQPPPSSQATNISIKVGHHSSN